MKSLYFLFSAFLIIATIAFGLNGNPIYAENKDITIYVYPAVTNNTVLATTSISSDYISNNISINAAPGENKSTSFVINSSRDISSLTIEISDLSSSQEVIDRNAVDIRVVKIWYQAGTGIKDLTHKKLTPELLLKDDNLIKVENEHNYVKLTDGTYKWISDPTISAELEPVISIDELPIQDKTILQPVDISAGINKQFWVTLKVPDNVSAGDYSGTIGLMNGNNLLEQLQINLKVLPFTLSDPLLEYNITHYGQLDDVYPSGSISDRFKSETQLTAELTNIISHGFSNTRCSQWFQGTQDTKLLKKVLNIRNDLGMNGRPLYYKGLDRSHYLNADKVQSVISLANSFDIPDVYFYGLDEAVGSAQISQRLAWETLRDAGGKTFVSGYSTDTFDAVGDILDLFVCNGVPDAREAAKWHSINHKIFSYNNPQLGSETPETYRRNYGLLLWQEDFDGAFVFAYQAEYGNIWNDFDHIKFRDHVMAYPTVNGVIDTIQWEGFREGINDVRYLTTLIKAIETARTEGKNTSEAETWVANLKNTDLINLDLDVVRSAMIDQILALQEAPEVDKTINYIRITPAGAESAASLINTNSSYTATDYNADMTEQSVPVNGQVVFTAEAYDGNNNPISGLDFTWSVNNAIAGSINSSGLFTAGAAGSYPNLVRASTTGGVTGTASITVIESPLVNPGNLLVDAGRLLQFKVSGDGDNSGLNFSASNLPDGAVFDASNQVFFWTPASNQSGIYNNIRFRATDGSYIVTEMVSITVGESNQAPVLVPVGDQTIKANTILSFTISGSDPDNDSLSYSASNLPAGAIFSSASRTFRWRPSAKQVGTYSDIYFQVSDGKLATGENITIRVNDINRAPVMDSLPTLTIEENQLLTFTLTASDPNGDNLVYTAYNLPKGASIDPASGVFSWTPTLTQSGKYRVRFSATDGVLSASTYVTIIVTDLNSAPVLEPIGDKSIPAGTKLAFTLAASDADGNRLTYSASNLPRGARINRTSGAFTWTPAASQAGTYTGIRFTVSDRSFSDSQDITITVTPPNKAPVMTATFPKTVKAGNTLSFQVDASDANGDNLTYTAQNLPAGASFNPATGEFSWTPTKTGRYSSIRFYVSDGIATVYKSVSITVTR